MASRSKDEAGWLAARRAVVTASESAHLLLLTEPQWRLSPERLAEQKLSGAEKEVTRKMAAGTWWEPHLLAYFTEITGVRTSGLTSLFTREGLPSMGATPDGVTHGIPGEPNSPLLEYLTVVLNGSLYQGLEAVGELVSFLADHGFVADVETKNQESRSRHLWNKPLGPPRYYENQVRHQLAVMDQSAGLLVARVDANELYVHCLERDDIWEPMLVDACHDFWEKYLKSEGE